MERFVSAIKKYLHEYNNFVNLKITEYDNKSIEFEDSSINVKFVVSWKTLLGRDFKQFSNEELNGIYDFWYKTMGKVENLLNGLSYRDDYCKDNNDLQMFGEIGFSMNSYAEFILLKKTVMHDDAVINKFKIENIDINVGVPSETFLMINKYLEDEPGFLCWDNYWTIKVNGVEDKESLNDYLQQALFLLDLSCPSAFKFGYEDISYLGDYSGFREMLKSRDFPRANFIEPIAFFNEATKRIYMNISDETVFMYFYKAIEYFYFINRKNEIHQILKDYSSDITRFIIEINNIYKTDERSCLKMLFNNSEIKPKIESIASEMHKKSIIPDEGVETFAGKLYLYRNSIVHGKGDTKFDLKVPRLLEESTRQESMSFYWNWAIQKIAFKCIKTFCYNNHI